MRTIIIILIALFVACVYGFTWALCRAAASGPRVIYPSDPDLADEDLTIPLEWV